MIAVSGFFSNPYFKTICLGTATIEVANEK